ncbi:MAG TPA: aspartyl protease family protein [Pyrinomonadaceae bacterium]|nr:aspartyl protease family protein [Pyrinomonadaceae bacterium]
MLIFTYIGRLTLVAAFLLAFLVNVTAQTRFTSGQSAVRVPFELAGDLIVLKVRVNRSRPLHFIFDTGAGISVIDPQSARALGLRAKGKLKLDATGGSVQSGLIQSVSLSVPGVEVFNQALATVDLDSFAPLFGYKIDGIIGHDFINNFVVEIDYASSLMNLYEPQEYKYRGAGESIPLEIHDKTPYVRARVVLNGREPIEGKFEIDTGGTGILNLNTPFVNKHKMLETLTKQAESKLGGAGGAATAVKAHVPAIELGSFAIKNPLIVFAQGTEGNENSTAFDGSLDNGLFSQFKMILDYSRSHVILERNNFARDLSGLEIVADPPHFKTFVVNAVEENSPAALAGIQEEDTILAIDGQPTVRLTLQELRQLLTQPGEHVLKIKHNSKTIQVRLRLVN